MLEQMQALAFAADNSEVSSQIWKPPRIWTSWPSWPAGPRGRGCWLSPALLFSGRWGPMRRSSGRFELRWI